MKGHLYIETVAQFHKEDLTEYGDPIPDLKLSYAAQGWFPITHSIKSGEFIKVSAERQGVRVEAHINTERNVPEGDNGRYEIHGGPYAGKGILRNVSSREHPDFKRFFACRSTASNGTLFLHWQVGLNELVDADSVDGSVGGPQDSQS